MARQSRARTRGAAPARGGVPTAGWPNWADPAAVGRLRDALRAGAVGHAYLLVGPKGVGKSDLARAFAQAVCCTAPQDGDRAMPCGACRACLNVARGAHPDVERIDLAAQAVLAEKPGRGANLSIETVRRLRASASLLPLEGARRILIVDDAETLLEPAQQALLKTLEEPPPAVTLLLLSDEPEALLETVRSRCQQISVRPVADSIISEGLAAQGVEAAAAAEIARLSRGCPAWAMAAASDATLLEARRGEWESARTWLSAPRYERLVTAFRLGEQFGKRRGEVLGVVQSAVQILRKEMLGAIDTGRAAPETRLFRGGPELALILSRATRASLQCLADLEANVRPRLALEAMVMTWPNSEPQSL